MDSQEPTTAQESPTLSKIRRPVSLSFICFAGFGYFGLMTIIFLAAILNISRISEVSGQYMPAGSGSAEMTNLSLIAGFILNLAIFTGTILVFRMRRSGFYLTSAALLLAGTWQLFLPDVSWFTTLFYILYLLLTGLHFLHLR